MFEIATLKLVRRYRKTRRAIRDANRKLGHYFYPISDDYDVDQLRLEAIPRAIDNAPKHEASGDVAVYSTFCGPLLSFTFDKNNKPRNVPHYFISNNPRVLKIVAKFGWKPILLNLPVSNNPVESAHQAKIAKALPHLFPDLKKHRFVVYSDDKQRIDHEKVKTDIALLESEGKSIAMRRAPHISGTILWEFAATMMQERYRLQVNKFVPFVDRSIRNGAELSDQELFLTDYSVRDQNHPETIQIAEHWYEAICECGIECQLSFDIIAQSYDSILTLAPKKKTKVEIGSVAPTAPNA